MTLPQDRPWRLVVTCEHASRAVPEALAARFAGHDALLDSHRGWDPGALELAGRLAARFGVPLDAGEVTRLIVDLNRSIGHRGLHSELTRDAPRAERADWIRRWYQPHRQRVEARVAALIGQGARVVHVAAHSFTPELGGVVRQADVAWLYDPARPGESAVARRWQHALAAIAPRLRLRRNYPYRGAADGLTRHLRQQHPDETYVGLELEVNQRQVLGGDGASWTRLQQDVVGSLEAALDATRPASAS